MPSIVSCFCRRPAHLIFSLLPCATAVATAIVAAATPSHLDDKATSLRPASAPAYEPLLDHLVAPRRALDLGGIWTVTTTAIDAPPPAADGSGGSGANDHDWQPVLVPDRHADLMRAKDKRVWFRRTISLPRHDPARSHVLHFERVTDVCDIYVNGHHIGHNEDGWFPFTVNATTALRAGDNELLVGILSPAASRAPGNRPVGWSWYLPHYAGIPFPVHLETGSNIRITDIVVQPALAPAARLRTRVTLRNDSARPTPVTVTAATTDDAFRHTPQTLTLAPGTDATLTLDDPWPAPRLWQPHDPHLYTLTVSLSPPGSAPDTNPGSGPAQPAIDARNQRFGFREVRVEGHRLLLNNRPFLHRRNSIICYRPFHDATKIRDTFTLLRTRGYVGSRLHGAGNDRIARVADELGWLLTVESGINEPRGHEMSDAFWPAAEQHVFSLVRHFRNHPSVIYWSLSNEFGSNYMPSRHPKGPWVDAWLAQLGGKVMAFDPTRTVTFSGDLELGGRNRHGPAPTLSYHYPWQPFKPDNLIPLTAYWLEEGRKPWQGVAWDRTKPVLLSEDLHTPYALKPPHGMTQWAGDKPYDPALLPEATFAAYRMLAEGYYHAGLTAWNPWDTKENAAENPLYQLGQLMPDYLLATRETNRTFASGEHIRRTLAIHNQLFRDLDVTLTRELRVPGQPARKTQTRFPLHAGAMREETITLPLPPVTRPTTAEWHLALHDNNNGAHELTRRAFTWTIFPPAPATATRTSPG
ncbi:MAG: hypothetical protein LBK99_14090, partial [Opitutaceae bacterium]|nr:hypothetical protein [Opitutaceae bacterium]